MAADWLGGLGTAPPLESPSPSGAWWLGEFSCVKSKNSLVGRREVRACLGLFHQIVLIGCDSVIQTLSIKGTVTRRRDFRLLSRPCPCSRAGGGGLCAGGSQRSGADRCLGSCCSPSRTGDECGGLLWTQPSSDEGKERRASPREWRPVPGRAHGMVLVLLLLPTRGVSGRTASGRRLFSVPAPLSLAASPEQDQDPFTPPLVGLSPLRVFSPAAGP